MNKQDLIDNIATKAQTTKKIAYACLDAFMETVTETIKKGDVVQLTGFGTFKRKSRAARVGRNPQTGKPLNIPAKLVPAFSPGKGFKNAVGAQEKTP
jgi:DNA-binding protein HU-beta